MLSGFVEWFESEYTSLYGGNDCSDIVQDDARNRTTRCSLVVIERLKKLKEILADNDYDFSQQP
jgi:hypothetical protein